MPPPGFPSVDDPARWPNLYIPGAAKAGTTSLHRYLGQHPGIHMAKVKEPDFFSTRLDACGDDPDRIAEAEAAYLDLFADADDATWLGEASGSYATRETVPERIAEVRPDARFVFSLRDPVDRTYSHYWMEHRAGEIDEDFPTALRLARDGEGTHIHDRMLAHNRYHAILERYLDVFDRDQVLVVLFDDLAEDPRAVLAEIAGFLDVDPDPMADVDVGVAHNPYRRAPNPVARWLRTSETVKKIARRVVPEGLREWLGDEVLLSEGDKPPMDADAKAELCELCMAEIDRLEALLDRELPELRASC